MIFNKRPLDKTCASIALLLDGAILASDLLLILFVTRFASFYGFYISAGYQLDDALAAKVELAQSLGEPIPANIEPIEPFEVAVIFTNASMIGNIAALICSAPIILFTIIFIGEAICRHIEILTRRDNE